MATSLLLTALDGIPTVTSGADLPTLISGAMERTGVSLRNDDLLVVAQKIVSKAEGRLVHLADVQPSERARELARRCEKDPRVVELILQVRSGAALSSGGHHRRASSRPSAGECRHRRFQCRDTCGRGGRAAAAGGSGCERRAHSRRLAAHPRRRCGRHRQRQLRPRLAAWDRRHGDRRRRLSGTARFARKVGPQRARLAHHRGRHRR